MIKKQKGTRMVKDGEDWHGLQTPNLKDSRINLSYPDLFLLWMSENTWVKVILQPERVYILEGVFNEVIIPLALVGYVIITANSLLHAPRYLTTISYRTRGREIIVKYITRRCCITNWYPMGRTMRGLGEIPFLSLQRFSCIALFFKGVGSPCVKVRFLAWLSCHFRHVCSK